MRYLTVLTLCVVAFAGCKTNPDKVSVKYINRHLTPEMQTLGQTHAAVSRDLATMQNQEWRMWWSDLGRAFYTDHPSRLSPMPVTYTSGEPR
jgi:hypothetical protein